MEILSNLGLGFETAFTLTNLMYCLMGVFIGTAVGVLPGLGPIATIAMLLPSTQESLPKLTRRPGDGAQVPPGPEPFR